MAERLFGIETEYAILSQGSRDESRVRETLLARIMNQAKQSQLHLRDMHSNGIFLANGARFYVDCGLHPEMTTPECTNPWDIVRYVLAGEQILNSIRTDLVSLDPTLTELAVLKGNVDYITRSTWGCHESYLHKADLGQLHKHIIPHLVSRIIYCGAGGFNPMSGGLAFTLSPRAWHIEHESSGNSTNSRGIFHTKDEPLAAHGYHRLHLLCGESLCSQTAMWLKVATTALVVAMIEAGLQPAEGISLRSSLKALKSLADDQKCKAKVELENSHTITALEIQRRYLGMAELHMHAPFMPPWAPEACEKWRQILDLLQQGPQAVDTVLDWAIKRSLYIRRAQQRGLSWDLLPHWTHVLTHICAALGRSEYANKTVNVDFLLSTTSPFKNDVQELSPYMQEHGLRWDDFSSFLNLRLELFEIDLRFGQLGNKGIFANLDRAGVLHHHIHGVNNIEHATANPPATGRARIRGECIRRLSGRNETCTCTWNSICDGLRDEMLDLDDPFAAEERWHKKNEQATSAALPEGILQRLQQELGRSAGDSRAERASRLARQVRNALGLPEEVPPR